MAQSGHGGAERVNNAVMFARTAAFPRGRLDAGCGMHRNDLIVATDRSEAMGLWGNKRPFGVG